MPLFRRPDGELVRDLPALRRIIPYLMRGRNESAVYHEQILDLGRTLPFIAEWNRAHADKLTLFHILVAACGRVLAARPGLNRFVSGGHIYQRHETSVAFAAKRRFADDAPLVTVKLRLAPGEPLDETVRHLHAAVSGGRSDVERPVDREVRLITRLPGFLIGWLIALARLLDRWNLLPAALLRDDPMYASVFLANLGSVGIDRTWHHLYEYGTVSLFGVLGTVRKELVMGEGGRPELRDVVRLRWTFDERINDGFYCAAALAMVRDYVEDPARLVVAEALPEPLARAME